MSNRPSFADIASGRYRQSKQGTSTEVVPSQRRRSFDEIVRFGAHGDIESAMAVPQAERSVWHPSAVSNPVTSSPIAPVKSTMPSLAQLNRVDLAAIPATTPAAASGPRAYEQGQPLSLVRPDILVSAHQREADMAGGRRTDPFTQNEKIQLKLEQQGVQNRVIDGLSGAAEIFASVPSSLEQGTRSTLKGLSGFSTEYQKAFDQAIVAPVEKLLTGDTKLSDSLVAQAQARNNQFADYLDNGKSIFQPPEYKTTAGRIAGSAVQSVPQMALSAVPGIGPALFYSSATGGYMDEAKQAGATDEQALAYGMLGGLFETGTEAATGMFGYAKKMLLKNLTGKLGQAAGKQVAESIVKDGIKQAAKEYGQEAVMTPLMNLAAKITYDPTRKKYFEWGKMNEEGMSGAVMSLVFSALGMPAGSASRRMAENLAKSEENITTDAAQDLQDQFNLDVKAQQQPVESQQKTIFADNDTVENYVSDAWNWTPMQPPLESQLPWFTVSDEAASAVTQITGKPVNGYTVALVDNDIRHVRKRHGPETKEGIPVSPEDFLRVPEIINDFDYVYDANPVSRTGEETIRFEKRFNGKTYLLAAIADDNNRLTVKQLIKVPTGSTAKFIKNIKRMVSRVGAPSENVPRNHARSALDHPSTTSKPFSNDNVNGTSSQKRQGTWPDASPKDSSKLTADTGRSQSLSTAIVPLDGSADNATHAYRTEPDGLKKSPTFQEMMQGRNMRMVTRADAISAASTTKGSVSSTNPIIQLWARRNAAVEHLNKVLKDLNPSNGEKAYAEAIIKGHLTEAAIHPNFDRAKIMAYAAAKEESLAANKALTDYKKQAKAMEFDRADKMIEGSTSWKDKRTGVQYSRETQERNTRDIMKNDAEAEPYNDYYFRPVHENEAEKNRWINYHTAQIKNLNLNPAESQMVQIYGEGLITRRDLEQLEGSRVDWRKIWKASADIASKQSTSIVLTPVEARLAQLMGEGKIGPQSNASGTIDVAKVSRGVATFRNFYAEAIRLSNDVITKYGYAPIPIRSNYFPHFEEQTDPVVKALSKMGIDMSDQTLPTDISGLTQQFRPGKRWVGNFLQRKGQTTTFDAVSGFGMYINKVSDVIYHTEDVQRILALEGALRTKFSSAEIQSEIDKIKAKEVISEDDWKRLDELYNTDPKQLPNYVSELRRYADNLAGKKSDLDRRMEAFWGRPAYRFANWLNNQVAKNMTAINPASWIINLGPMIQAGAEINPKHMLKAANDTLRNFAKDDGFINQSTFLTNRHGADRLSKSIFDQAVETATSPMRFLDELSSSVLTRAKYEMELERSGDPEEAMRRADAWVASAIADRSKGAMPTLFHSKNPLTRIFTAFQVEVNNNMSHYIKDIPKDAKDLGAKWLAAYLVQYFVGSWLLNEAFFQIIGRKPFLDPVGTLLQTIRDQDDKGIMAKHLFDDVGGQIPFVGTLVSAIGGSGQGGRYPLAAGIPDMQKITAAATGMSDGETDPSVGWKTIGKELAKPASYVLMPVGGGQMKKTIEGLGAFGQGASLTSNGQMRFPIEQTPLNAAQTAVFGQYATKEGREYLETNARPMSEKNTQAIMNAPDMQEAFKRFQLERQINAIQDRMNKIWSSDSSYQDKKDRINDLADEIDELRKK